MNISAHDIQAWCLLEMDELMATGRFRSRNQLHLKICELSGLSPVFVQLFHKGQKDNPTVDTLDRLTNAIREISRARAA